MTNDGVQTFKYCKILDSPFNKITVTLTKNK